MRKPSTEELRAHQTALLQKKELDLRQQRAYCEACQQDVATLHKKLEDSIVGLQRVKFQAMEGLVRDAECWAQVLKWYTNKNRSQRVQGREVNVTTQDTRIDWRPQVAKAHTCKIPHKLKIATFGWWEIKMLTEEAYDKLVKHLVIQ